jgi:hypothetical protein
MTDTALVTANHAVTDAQDHQHGPGSQIKDFDAAHPHNARLLTSGLVVLEGEPDLLTGDALTERARELDIKGRTTMTADQLREAIAKAEANPDPQEGSA